MSDDTRDSGRPPSTGEGDERGPSASEFTETARAGHLARRRSSGEGDVGIDDGQGAPLHAVDTDLAPVIPLFGAPQVGRPRDGADAPHPSRGRSALGAPLSREAAAPPPARPRLRALRNHDAQGGSDVSASEWNVPGGAAGGSAPFRADAPDGTDDARERAEALLLRKLRSRSLSLSEARTAIRGVDGADETVVEDLVARFVDLGYLDDAAFAEQLAMSAVERRGEGRRAVAETLRKRGIPRDIAEAALAELPDDDAERALDFARSKVRGVEGKDYEASLRRLAGQLARRGYPSSVALTAAKTALSEAGVGRARSFGRPASGVRFTPDD